MTPLVIFSAGPRCKGLGGSRKRERACTLGRGLFTSVSLFSTESPFSILMATHWLPEGRPAPPGVAAE